MPGLPVHHQLPEFTQTHVIMSLLMSLHNEFTQNHVISVAIQPSHPLSSPSPPVFNVCQHQGLFK